MTLEYRSEANEKTIVSLNRQVSARYQQRRDHAVMAAASRVQEQLFRGRQGAHNFQNNPLQFVTRFDCQLAVLTPLDTSD